MWRRLTTAVVAVFCPALLGAQTGAPAGAPAGAPTWNDPRALALVQRATDRRAAQLADTGLRNYKAEARGYLTFLAQLGEGFREPPKVVRTDQIASDVYWQAPNFTKQMVKGRRDTLLLPTDIQYHRDHLGIVQNNFPNIIRLGDGDEVEDVPHPLSAVGLREYDFGLRDSLQIRLGANVVSVYEVAVRPKNDRLPRAVGSVYIDQQSGEVVRMALSFTRAALKDKELEDVSVVLENALTEGRFWLPHRQEIEIRRTGTWLDYPARGIIRGRWEIGDYEVNTDLSGVVFAGPEIVAAPGAHVLRNGAVTTPGFQFAGNVLDSLPPDVRAVSDEDVRRVQDEVRTLVRNRALARSRTVALSGRRVSDFLHVDRVEGIAAGAGFLQPIGGGFALGGNAGYGFSDREWKGGGRFAYTGASGAGVEFAGYRTLRDVSDVPERSGLINTFAAQEFASDYTDLYDARGGALRVNTGFVHALRLSGELAFERQNSVSAHAKPASGHFRGPLFVPPWRETRATLALDLPGRPAIAGFGIDARLSATGIWGRARGVAATAMPAVDCARFSGLLDAERDRGTHRIILRTIAAATAFSNDVPPQHLVYFGGPVTAPGYEIHSLVGRAGVSQRIEWQRRVPFVAIPLGAWGRAPASITLAPYANVAWVDGRPGWRPSVGVGALTIFELLRVDVARGLRDGRWMFGLDVSRAFWSVL